QQGIVMYYIAAIIVAFLMLNLPFVHKSNVSVDPIDSLFVAVSGVSVTGLTPVNIIDTYTTFGQVVIMLILNLGGIGVMAIGTMLWVVLGKHIGMRERQLIMLDNNKHTMSGTVKLILDIVRTIIIIELVGESLLTNGGLDITRQTIIPYANDYFVQTIVMFVIMLDSIGFAVLIEVKAYIKKRIPNFRFSLFAKITTVTYFGLFIFGVLIILL